MLAARIACGEVQLPPPPGPPRPKKPSTKELLQVHSFCLCSLRGKKNEALCSEGREVKQIKEWRMLDDDVKASSEDGNE